METFSIPGVAGILEKMVDGNVSILLQERWKEDTPGESGLIEIPAGKIRAFESIFDCLNREVQEETGLEIVTIRGEKDSSVIEANGYQVINYTPFSCAQNLKGSYPIMVQVFICEVKGELLERSDETKNFQWITIDALAKKLRDEPNRFYPMHIKTLEKYIQIRKEGKS